MKNRPSGRWFYSVRPWEDKDGGWYNECFVAATSAKEAAERIRDQGGLQTETTTFWVVPMTSPEEWADGVWDLPNERKYQAELYVALWDDDEAEKVEL